MDWVGSGSGAEPGRREPGLGKGARPNQGAARAGVGRFPGPQRARTRRGPPATAYARTGAAMKPDDLPVDDLLAGQSRADRRRIIALEAENAALIARVVGLEAELADAPRASAAKASINAGLRQRGRLRWRAAASRRSTNGADWQASVPRPQAVPCRSRTARSRSFRRRSSRIDRRCDRQARRPTPRLRQRNGTGAKDPQRG